MVHLEKRAARDIMSTAKNVQVIAASANPDAMERHVVYVLDVFYLPEVCNPKVQL